MARFQRGSLRIEERSASPTWVLRYYRTREVDGKRVEQTAPVGLVAVLGKSESAAWQEVQRLHMHEKINDNRPLGAVTFGAVAASYLEHELEHLAHTTATTTRHNCHRYLLPRWAKEIAVDIDPLAVERWLKELVKGGLARPTVAKYRQLMHSVYRHGQRVGLLPRTDEGNPIKYVRASAKTDYRALVATPDDASRVVSLLNEPVRTLAILSAATALRISESLGLQWQDIDFPADRIHVRRTWTQRTIGLPKTEASAQPVPMHPMLAEALQEWRAKTPYWRDGDWLFASTKLHGKQPREGNLMAADYLRPALIKAGIIPADFRGKAGWHSFRHGLATALVSSGTDTKTVQDMLRHAKVQTTLDLYAASMPASRVAAQGEALQAIFNRRSTQSLCPEPTAS